MSEPGQRGPTLLCVASFFKGNEFLRECRRRGGRAVLLTREKLLGADWARDSLDDVIAIPAHEGPDFYLHAASHAARRWRVGRVVALEEYDVVTAARVREHLALPGTGSTAARNFHDKLAMRFAAHAAGLAVPEFAHLLNRERVAEFLARVPAPWMLKPRVGASAMGIRKLHAAEEVWRAWDALDADGERASQHLLERFVPGDVFHVDSLVSGGRVRFAHAGRYGVPPFEVAHGGGVSTTRTVRRGSAGERGLLAANRKLLRAFGLERGATHAEFIRGDGGTFYFLEVAARVGGAYTVETVEAATGVNLWREWAAVETAAGESTYEPPPARADYAGLALSLARQERPDTAAYADEEIVFRVDKPWHVGLVVRSPDHARVEDLLGSYARRFAEDFTAVAPPEEGPTQHL